MVAIQNLVLDMGNVLFDYNPGAMTEYFLPAAPEEDKKMPGSSFDVTI